MRTHAFAVALKALVVRRGRVLVLKRSRREDNYAEKWDVPGGRMEWGEEPLTALRREIAEETGLKVEIGEPVSVWQFKATDKLQVIGLTLRAKSPKGTVRVGSEHEEARWSAPEDARNLDMDEGLRSEILRFAR